LNVEKSEENLQTWFTITNNDKFSKDWWLKDQIRRAAVWIISNIAEGFERNYDKEFKQFLYIAKWSCAEVRAQLYIAYDQEYISEKDFITLIDLCIEISKMTSKFITYLNKS